MVGSTPITFMLAISKLDRVLIIRQRLRVRLEHILSEMLLDSLRLEMQM
jgi:hypothetical protein